MDESFTSKALSLWRFNNTFPCQTLLSSTQTPQIPEGLKLALHKRESIKYHITIKFSVTIFVRDSIQKNTKVYGPLSQRKCDECDVHLRRSKSSCNNQKPLAKGKWKILKYDDNLVASEAMWMRKEEIRVETIQPVAARNHLHRLVFNERW
jgi:hypothetical protein